MRCVKTRSAQVLSKMSSSYHDFSEIQDGGNHNNISFDNKAYAREQFKQIVSLFNYVTNKRNMTLDQYSQIKDEFIR